jgi:hypothetical protein
MESLFHRRLVRYAADAMREQGARVTHDTCDPRLPDPILIGAYKPDLIAFGDGEWLLGEAETAESIKSAHTRRQLRAFSAASVVIGKPARLVLCVPAESIGAAYAVLFAERIFDPSVVVLGAPSRPRPARRMRPRPQAPLQCGRQAPVPQLFRPLQRGRAASVPGSLAELLAAGGRRRFRAE